MLSGLRQLIDLFEQAGEARTERRIIWAGLTAFPQQLNRLARSGEVYQNGRKVDANVDAIGCDISGYEISISSQCEAPGLLKSACKIILQHEISGILTLGFIEMLEGARKVARSPKNTCEVAVCFYVVTVVPKHVAVGIDR